MQVKTKRSRFSVPPVQKHHGWMILNPWGDFWTSEVFPDAMSAFDLLDKRFANMGQDHIAKFRVVRGYTTMHLLGLEEAEVDEAVR
jgi:hypothetical protein